MKAATEREKTSRIGDERAVDRIAVSGDVDDSRDVNRKEPRKYVLRSDVTERRLTFVSPRIERQARLSAASQTPAHSTLSIYYGSARVGSSSTPLK